MHAALIEPKVLPGLTKIQTARFALRVQGNSLAQIAEAEGVTKQAVAKSLSSPTVQRAAFTLLGRPLTTTDETGEVDLVCHALKVIAETMCNATRPVVLTETGNGFSVQRVQFVPDHATRLAAAARLIGLVDRPASSLQQFRF
jgi:hypothetical protein